MGGFTFTTPPVWTKPCFYNIFVIKPFYMKKTLLFCAFACPVMGMTQTTLFSENFEGGTAGQFTLNTSDLSSASAINSWLVNNAYTGGSATFICLSFPLTLPVLPNLPQPAGITGSPNSYYMHINANGAASSGVLNSNYRGADGLCTPDENNFAKMSADISTVGYTGVSLSFWWGCGGSAGEVYGQVYYSIDGGTNWILVTSPVAQYYGQINWTQQTITLPAFDNQASLRFGFRFVNTIASGGTDPGFQLDDIKITGTPGCVATGSTQTPAICQGQTYFAQGAYQTMGGIYYDTLVNACGADSVITTNLTVTPVDISITAGSASLIAGATSATYQWIDCATMLPIGGETNQTYTPTANGSYAAIITQSGCTDTTACELFMGLGITEPTASNLFSVYPNPSQGIIHINTNGLADQVIVTDLTGKQVQNVKPVAGITTIDLGKKASGIYFVTVKQQGAIQTLKVAVN